MCVCVCLCEHVCLRLHLCLCVIEGDHLRVMYNNSSIMQIEINAGRATKCERNFLVTPSPGSSFVVKGLVSQASMLMEIGNSVPALNFGRKPFDWMSDAQWQTMLVRMLYLYMH